MRVFSIIKRVFKTNVIKTSYNSREKSKTIGDDMIKIIQGREMFAEEIVESDGSVREIYYLMKVRYKGETNLLDLIHGKEYYVTKEHMDDGYRFYSVIDETGEEYLYSLRDFEIIKSML